MRLAVTAIAAFAAAALAALAVASCGASDFDPESKLKSVRILATRADQPYAKPGATVQLETLAYDGRPDTTTRPMKIFWLPLVCENPKDDLYYLCFSQFAGADGGAADGGARDGGAPMRGGGFLQPGVDLSPFLPTGPTYSFTVSPDIIDRHPVIPGANGRYGLAVVFSIACAGHIEIIPAAPGDIRKQQVPLGCFDASHTQLGPDDYVIGVQRVYAYDDRTNANPVIDHVVYQGQPLDLTQGITVDRCTSQRRSDCPDLKLDIFVPDASWELNPGDTDQNNNERHEQLWVDWYESKGDFDGDARLLFDPAQGRVTPSEIKYHAAADPADGDIVAVVHDNRGGVAWVRFPVHVQ
jgi:hypothetical protein